MRQSKYFVHSSTIIKIHNYLMASLKEIRNRITSVASTQQITKAMKMVAAAKLRRAQDAITQMRPYAKSLNDILGNLSENAGEVTSPYLEKRNPEKILLVITTSDRGLCGGFNSSVTKYILSLVAGEYASQHAKGNVHLLAIGKKGLEYFQKRKFPMVGQEFSTIFTRLSFGAVKEAAEFVMDAFAEKQYDKVELIYNEFKNVATQILCKDQLLPIVEDKPSDLKNETKAKLAEKLAKDLAKKDGTAIDYVLEPSPEEIMLELLPKSLKIRMFKAVLESNASEQGARMSAMDKATENAGELLKQLKLTYNRSRQAAITKEILEIVGGAEALG